MRKRHIFTPEERAKSIQSHREKTLPAVRSRAARAGARARWYRPLGSHEERIDTHLQILAHFLRNAVAENNMDTILRIQAVMARFEQIRINLDRGPKPVEPIGTQLMAIGQEAAARYEAGRARGVGDEIIIDPDKEKDEPDKKS